jgi:hypothetical protein
MTYCVPLYPYCMQRKVSCARNVIWHLGHISTHFWHGMGRDPTRGHRASYEMVDVHDVDDLDRSGAGPISSPIHTVIRKLLFFLILIFSKFQSDCRYVLIQENRKMPSEWLMGVLGGRSYGASPRGKSLPGPAVHISHNTSCN